MSRYVLSTSSKKSPQKSVWRAEAASREQRWRLGWRAAVADFKTALEALGRGELKIDTVSANITTLLARKPSAAVDLMQHLREAFGGGVIDEQTYAELKRCVGELSANEPERTRFTPADRARLSTIIGAETTDGRNTDSQPNNSSWDRPTNPPPGDVKLEPGTVLKERFTLDEVLGVGGMGTVYKGRDLIKVEARDKNPYIALKVLNEDFKKHPDSFIALQREASRQQKLAHPNIATVYDFDRTGGGTVFLTMEMLEGQPLNLFIKNTVRPRNGLSFAEAWPMVQGLGNALIYAHERNIVHSDFKPGNCFLTLDGTMKVLDFGIARAVKNPGQSDGEKTLFDPSKLGALTPAYASAEMLEGREPDQRDDIYALACVTYELLTGRHPFNKIPAKDARDNHLAPAPIKGLTRKQMRGLLRGLAFDRRHRSQNVAEFVREFEGRTPPLKNPLIVVPAITVLLLLGGGYPLMNLMHQRDLNARIASAQTGDPVAIDSVLAGLTTLSDPTDQERVLVAARDAILQSFENQVNAKIDLDRGQLDFTGARALISRLQSFHVYKDSAQVKALTEQIEQRENALLAAQTERFNTLLERGALLARDGEDDVTDPLDLIRRFAPQVVEPLQQRLPGAYAAAIEHALTVEDFVHAGELSAAGLKLVPGSKSLLNLTDKIDNERERAALAAKILTLTGEIRAALAQFTDFASLEPVRDLVPALAVLAPDHPVLQELADKVVPVATRELNTAMQTRRWSDTALVRADYRPLLRVIGAPELSARVGNAIDAMSTAVENSVARLINVLGKSPVDPAAPALVKELQAIAPNHADIAFAKDLLARAYWRDARSARTNGQQPQAQAAIAAGLALTPSPQVAAALETESLLASSNERAADPAAAAAALKAASATLNNEADIAAAFGALHALDLTAAAGDLADSSRQAFAQAVARRSTELGAAENWDQALTLTQRALVYLPRSPVLSERLSDIQHARHRAELAAQQQHVASLKQAVEQLIAAPQESREWRDKIESALAEISTLVAREEPWLVGYNGKLAALYIDRARDLRAAERFAESASVLERAARFAPGLPEIALEQTALSAATSAFEQEQREVERQARIAALKETFYTQTRANDVVNAAKSLAAVSAELGENDDFVRNQAPQQLARAHYRLAVSRAGAQDFATALRLAKAGLKLKPNDQDLRLAVKEYTVSGNRQALSRLLKESSFDVKEALDRIGEVQTLDPRAYGAAENAWASAIVKRVRDLQASGGAAANPFVEQAQSVFAGNELVAALGPIASTVATFPGSGAIEAALKKSLLTAARELLTRAVGEAPDHPDLARLKGQYNGRLNTAKTLYEDYKTAFRSRDFAKADSAIDEAIRTWADSTTFQKEKARVVAALRGATAGSTSSTIPVSRSPCGAQLAGHGSRRQGICYDMVAAQARGPLLVVVPAGGDFAQSFAIGKYEVTVSDFNAYCRLTEQCTVVTDREGALPITGITLEAMTGYAKWLSTRTSHTYRLPNAAEWEYAARAGGKQSPKDYNCRVEQNGQVLKGQSALGVNTGRANAWGLYNTVGNAQELVTGGQAVEARGGAFEDAFSKCKIELAKPHDGNADPTTGFRLVRELS